PEDVDDDADRRRCLLSRSEGDVDSHPARLVAMSTAQLQSCSRHPDRETGVSCSECGRPICADCMTVAPVGIRCPDHAGGSAKRARAGSARPSLRAPTLPTRTTAALVTKILIGLNVAVYLITVVQGAGINSP